MIRFNTPARLILASLGAAFSFWIAIAYTHAADTTGNCSTGLDSWVQRYIKAHRDFQQGKAGAFEAAKYELAGPIINRVLSEPHLGWYQTCLTQIDRYSNYAPEAIADLAYSLQLEWEKKYLLLALEETRTQTQWMNVSSHLSTDSASMLFPFYAIRSASGFVPGYLKFFLKTAFVAGPMAHTYFANKTSKYPPAPAQVLSLGTRIHQDYSQEALFDQSMRQSRSELAGATSGLVAFYYAGRVLMYTGEAGTFLMTKPSPWSIAAGIGLAILADSVTTEAAGAIENYRNNIQLKARLITAERNFLKESSCSIGDNAPLIKATVELIGAALKTEAYTNLDFLDGQSKYEQKVAESPQDAEFLRQERHRELRAMVLKRRYGADPFYMRREARDIIKNYGITGAKAQLETLPNALKSALNSVLSDYQTRRGTSLDVFLKEGQSIDNQFLIKRFHARLQVGGAMNYAQPDALLLEVAAMIEQTGSNFLNTYAEQVLIDRVRKYAALFEAAMGP